LKRRLVEPQSEKQLVAYALRLLARRDYSVQELGDKMRGRAVSELAVDNAIDFLVSKGWLDDYRYGAALCRTLVERGYGPRYIEQKWYQKGIQPHRCFPSKSDNVPEQLSNGCGSVVIQSPQMTQNVSLSGLLCSYDTVFWVKQALAVLESYARKKNIEDGDGELIGEAAKLRRRLIALLQRRGYPESCLFDALALHETQCQGKLEPL